MPLDVCDKYIDMCVLSRPCVIGIYPLISFDNGCIGSTRWVLEDTPILLLDIQDAMAVVDPHPLADIYSSPSYLLIYFISHQVRESKPASLQISIDTSTFLSFPVQAYHPLNSFSTSI